MVSEMVRDSFHEYENTPDKPRYVTVISLDDGGLYMSCLRDFIEDLRGSETGCMLASRNSCGVEDGNDAV